MTATRFFRRAIGPALAVLLAAAHIAPALAQTPSHSPPSPLHGRQDAPRLAPADVALMDRTAERLYRAPSVPDGASDTWRNERTGSFGRVTVLATVERTLRGTGLTCRKVQYDVATRFRTDPATTAVTWCRQPNGTWKLL